MTEQIYARPGSIALVTGAGSGIWERTAEALAGKAPEILADRERKLELAHTMRAERRHAQRQVA